MADVWREGCESYPGRSHERIREAENAAQRKRSNNAKKGLLSLADQYASVHIACCLVLNRRMTNVTYGGVRGRNSHHLDRIPPTRFKTQAHYRGVRQKLRTPIQSAGEACPALYA